MEKITDVNGKVHQFNKLVYNEKNLSKVRLSVNDEQVEGIWVVLDEADKKKVDDDNSTGEYFVAMLANDALNFYPNRSWGLHVLCKTNGEDRPLCDLTWVDYDKNLVFSDDVNK